MKKWCTFVKVTSEGGSKDRRRMRPTLWINVNCGSEFLDAVPELQREFARSPSLLPIQRSFRKTAGTVAVSNSQLPWS